MKDNTMVLEQYKYSNGYNYDEYSAMCDQFKGIKLPFLKGYDVHRLLAEYIFGYSMNRFPVGIKNTLRRFLGGMFLYPVIKEGEGNTAFIFTGDSNGRPDYVQCIRKVKTQCDDSVLYIMDRTKPQFTISHIFSFITELIWAVKLNSLNHDFNISFDMAVSLYRAQKQGKHIYKVIGGTRRIVTFCDLWNIESIITQKANREKVPTATLQHGNGTDILYGSCSKYYLSNSKLSTVNCLYAGMPENKVILVGLMKYAGEKFKYKEFSKIKKIGVVFDGAQNFENNVEMIQVIHKALEGTDIKCCIRFHPNNNREDYQLYMSDSDEVYDDLAEFEKSIDICIVYNSSMYTDMIYKKILVYRFKNGKVDLFLGLNDKGFSNSEELNVLLADIEIDRNEYIGRQEILYDQIFGTECQTDSYKKFFDEKFR